MAGLLDGGYSPDPLAMGLLGMGGALLTPRQLGGGIGPAMNAFSQQAMQAQMLKRQMAQDDIQRQMLGLRMSEAQEGAEDRKRRRAQEDALQQAARGAYTPAMPGVGDENNPYLPVKDTPAQFDRKRYIDSLYGAGFPGQAMEVEKSFQQDSPFAKIDPAKFTPESIAAFQQTGGRDPSVLRPFVAPEKPPAPPNVVRLMAERDKFPPGSPQHKILSDAIIKETQFAPPSTTSVTVMNDGQKGFENEFKLRDGFKGEPVYKAHQEMQSAYTQIVESLAKGTPVGDMAGATKIMKLLDPGSVVRESELGMAMAATGLLDRARNYAQMVASGQKLTPQQRIEFRSLADSLYQESVKQYNSKRGEYSRLGGEYRLNADRALGPEAGSAPAAPQAFPMLPDAKQHDGKVATDRQTGRRYKSINGKWEPQP